MSKVISAGGLTEEDRTMLLDLLPELSTVYVVRRGPSELSLFCVCSCGAAEENSGQGHIRGLSASVGRLLGLRLGPKGGVIIRPPYGPAQYLAERISFCLHGQENKLCGEWL